MTDLAAKNAKGELNEYSAARVRELLAERRDLMRLLGEAQDERNEWDVSLNLYLRGSYSEGTIRLTQAELIKILGDRVARAESEINRYCES